MIGKKNYWADYIQYTIMQETNKYPKEDFMYIKHMLLLSLLSMNSSHLTGSEKKQEVKKSMRYYIYKLNSNTLVDLGGLQTSLENKFSADKETYFTVPPDTFLEDPLHYLEELQKLQRSKSDQK